MTDDGRCHICRRVPVEQSPLYAITTCRDCNESELTGLLPRVLWSIALLVSPMLVWVAMKIMQ